MRFILKSKTRETGLKFYDQYDDKKVAVLPGFRDRLEDDGTTVTLETIVNFKVLKHLFPKLTKENLSQQIHKQLAERGIAPDTYSLEVLNDG